jgi:hypothetical protein
MRRVAMIGTAIGLALPAAALAKQGWKLPARHAKIGSIARTTVTASRCAATKYGVYRVVSRIVTAQTTGKLIYDVNVTRDGGRHRPAGVHTSGSFPTGLRAAVVKDVLSGTYELRNGYVWGVNGDGSLGGPLVKFSPRSTRC